jgi:hypothetical protein
MVENAEVRIVYTFWEELRVYVDNIKLDSKENVAKA